MRSVLAPQRNTVGRPKGWRRNETIGRSGATCKRAGRAVSEGSSFDTTLPPAAHGSASRPIHRPYSTNAQAHTTELKVARWGFQVALLMGAPLRRNRRATWRNRAENHGGF